MLIFSKLSLALKIIAFYLILIPPLVNAAGFNCAKAKTFIEIEICADSYLSMLDSELNAVFDEAQSETSGIDGETGKRIDPVGAEQKKWIKNIRNKCQNKTCLIRAYETRINEIKMDWIEK
jgi:uncharacterized protein